MWWIHSSWTLQIVLGISMKEVSRVFVVCISMNHSTLTEKPFIGKLLLCATTFWVAPTHFLLFCWSWYKCLPDVCLVWVGVKRSVVDSELSTSCLFQNSEWSLNSVAHSSLCCKHTRAGKQIVRADEIIMMSSNGTTTTFTSHADKTIQQYLSFILISDTLWFTTNKAASSPALLAHEQAT